MRTFCRPLLGSLIVSALAAPHMALAADSNTTNTDKTRVLAPTVVTATRIEQDAEGIPPSATTTTRETLDERFIRNFQDLGMRAEPGIEARRDQRNGNTQINIRGLQGARVLTLVDGIRLPDVFEFQGRDGIGQDMVDFSSLKSVDIVRGPGSTLYGSSALAGIVGLRTLDPSDLLEEGKDFGGRAAIDYNSADNGRSANVALAGRLENDRTEWLLQVGGRKGQAYETQGKSDTAGTSRTEANPQRNSRSSVLGKLQHNFAGGHKLGLTTEFRKTSYHTNLQSEIGSLGVQSSHADDSEKRSRVSLEYDYRAPDASSFVDLASARLYYSRLDADQFKHQVRTSAPRYERNGQYRQSLYGLSALASKQLDGAITNRISAGGEWWQSRTDEFAAGFPNISTINVRTVPKTNITQFGLFVEDEIGFADGQFSLTPGIRYDHYKQAPKIDATLAEQIASVGGSTAKQSGSRFSPKLLASWHANDSVTLFAQYAQGFRAPNLVEVNGQFTNAGSGYTLHPNPDLKPETSSGYEVGARWQVETASASLTFFDTRYKNFIEMTSLAASDPVSNPDYLLNYQYRNIERVRIYGAELQGQWQFMPSWNVWGSLAWAHGRNRSDDTYLDSVSPLKTIAGLRYSQQQWGGEAILTLARKRNQVSADTIFKAPGYGTLDLIGWYEPANVKGLRVQAGIMNVFDKTYWRTINVQGVTASAVNLDRYTEAGRTFQASLSYQF